MNNKKLGQFFSPEKLVELCLSISTNKGNVLEPSYGDGSFKKIKQLYKEYVLIELDKNIINDKEVINIDFFDFPENTKFDTVIGNPPFVDNKNIIEETFNKLNFDLLNKGSNLYLHFILKCFFHLKENGELIFIVPREFIKLTSAQKLNKLLFDNGTITHYFDFGDEKFFKGASPNICIFRYQKNNFNRKTITNEGIKDFVISEGQFLFINKEKNVIKLGEIFDIKVGAVSGADNIFLDNCDGEDFVFSKTKETNKTKKMSYNIITKKILEKKEVLKKRKIKQFNESNWWKWGREINFKEEEKRIYVNTKTRKENPFFINDCKKWDGSILALFPKDKNIDIEKYKDYLNSIDWNTLGFKSGNRFLFSQRSLSNALIEINIDKAN